MDYFDILFAKNNGISKGTCYNEIETMLKSTVGHSSKNLIPITLESGRYEQGGASLDYTVDKVAGTITLNGSTRTSGAGYLTVFNDIDGKIAGKLYLSGGYNDSARLFCYDITADAYPKQWDGVATSVASKGENDSVEELLIAGHNNEVRLRFYAGYTFNNVVLKPMLRDGSISDDTFEPYVTPTDEKKQDKPVVLWEAALNSTGVSDVPISSLADAVSNYSYLKVVVTNELGTTITDETVVQTDVEYDTSYIGQEVVRSTGGMLGFHTENGRLVFDRLFIWVYSEGTNISVRGLRNHNDTSTPPDVVPSVFIRKIIGIPK